MWAQLTDEQRETYGEEYFEQALRSLEKYTKEVRVFIQIYYSKILFIRLFFVVVIRMPI